MNRVAATFIALVICPPLLRAEEPAWQALLGDFVKNEKPGFGGLCGVTVDHATGAVWVNLSDRGFYRSDDGAKTFKRAGEQQPRGRTESPGCFLLDPTGKSKRMLSALVYGSPIGVSDDGGSTWRTMHAKSSHVDWCAVDWSDPEMKFVLTLRHESGGLLLASHDGGASFSEIGKGYGPGWVFNQQTAVVAEAKSKERATPNLMRTVDGGKTWKPCGAYSPVGAGSLQALPRWRDGRLYWLVDGKLIATDDQGATWKELSAVKDGRCGPVFGKDAKHLFLLTNSGAVESTDAGATWSKPIAPPKALKGVGGLTWLEYDPTRDVLYLMKMGSELFTLTLPKRQ
jgi:photosystem II stability/assembly factor-like uncharacterized protein